MRSAEIPVAPPVRDAHGGDGDDTREGGRAKAREECREHSTHNDVLDEPERAHPGRQHGVPQSQPLPRRRATAAPGVLFFPTMCGIVGYTGPRQAAPVLLEGLRRLEYRGYDSAGLALVADGRIEVYKAAGKISVLEKALGTTLPAGHTGIAHTRWATHGAPNTVNAHPHTDCGGTLALVHNGIIENAGALRTALGKRGHVFRSETDTEVLAHLAEELLASAGSMVEAVAGALHQVEGTYGIAVVSTREPDTVVAARRGSPLLVAVGAGENFVASDASAVLSHTRSVVYLDDGEIAVVRPSDYRILDLDTVEKEKAVTRVDWDLATIERGGHAHFMLKEIMEQPESLRNTLRGRLLEEDGTARLGGLNINDEQLLQVNRIVFTACGTSWHSALIGEYMMEELARIPSEVEYASEFRYRNPIGDERTLVERGLAKAPAVERIAERMMRASNVLYLGRGYNFPVALEGALKLKEISYIHAEGYPAAEMKHGPIALIDDLMPVVFLAPKDAVYQKVVSNVEEVKARGGRVIAVVTEGDSGLAKLADQKIEVPETLDLLTPVLTVLPLQLFAYHIAVRRGCNVDQPRNLAKSVTVEGA